MDIGWGCGGGHSGLRRCGMAKGSDSRGTRLFADGTGAARNESSKPFYRKIFKETILFDKMSAAIQTSMGLDTALQEGAMQTQNALIEAMPLPEFLKEALLENNNPVIYQLLHAESLKEYIAGYLANVCINVLSVAAAFVLIYIVVKVVINALHLFSKLPGLNFLNRFSGFLVGGAKGLSASGWQALC